MTNATLDSESSDSKKVHGHGDFVTGSVRVVDYDTANGNILIRGSSAFGALIAGSETPFTIGALIKAIEADVNFASTGISLSATPMIIDFCLIGFGAPTSKDGKIVSAEVSWFSTTPPTPPLNGSSGPYPAYVDSNIKANPGVMVYWPILSLGTGTTPAAVGDTWTQSPATSIGYGGTNYDYSDLVPAIRHALTGETTLMPEGFPASISSIQNAIIYIHCDSGVNRTGAAVAGYLMRYGSQLAALNLPSIAGATPYTLIRAQTAANLAPPINDSTPNPGGTDIPVVQAYCNYLATDNICGNLVENCVPLFPIPQ